MGLLLLLISSSTQNLFSEDCEIEILNYYTVDACEDRNERDILLALDAGVIKKEDQFFGYELAIIIDTSRIRITDIAKINTLSEFMDHASFAVYSDTIVVSAVTLGNNPIWGSSKVIALSGYYKDSCAGSALVEIDYFYPTDEFQRDIVYKTRETEILAEIKDLNDRKMTIGSAIDTLKGFEEDSVAECEFEIELFEKKQVREFEFKLELLNGQKFEIQDIVGIDENLEILEKNPTEKGLIAKARILKSSDKFELTCTVKDLEKKLNKDRLLFEILNINDCACVTRFEGDEVLVEGDLETSVMDESTSNTTKKIIIDRYIYLKDRHIKDLILLDNLGRRVDESLYMKTSDYLDLSNLNKGIYFVVYQSKNMKKSFIVIKS